MNENVNRDLLKLLRAAERRAKRKHHRLQAWTEKSESSVFPLSARCAACGQYIILESDSTLRGGVIERRCRAWQG